MFHTPGEHTINGQTFDMEMSVLFYGRSKGDINRQITLNFLLKKKAGASNKLFEVLDMENIDLPNPIDRETVINLKNGKRFFIPDIFSNDETVNNVRQEPIFSFYQYDGSLTFPPCTENTQVFVASEPIEVGKAFVEMFEYSLKKPEYSNFLSTKDGSYDDMNRIATVSNRAVQPKNGRPILYFNRNDCITAFSKINKKVEKAEPVSHYEKVVTTVKKRIFVEGDKPVDQFGAKYSSIQSD